VGLQIGNRAPEPHRAGYRLAAYRPEAETKYQLADFRQENAALRLGPGRPVALQLLGAGITLVPIAVAVIASSVLCYRA
jgi:hypothetical protein